MGMSGGAPANLDAERSVLGMFFKEPVLLTVHGDGLVPGDFYTERHQFVFEAMKAVVDRGEILDFVTVGEELARQKRLEGVGGPVFLEELSDDVGSTIGLEHHLKIVRDKSMLRRMISAATDIASKGYSPDLDLSVFMDDAEKRIFEVVTGGQRQPMRPIKDVMAETLQTLYQQQQAGGAVSGLPTGFDDLDRITLGMHRSDLMIIAARPGMGKTALAMSIATHAALNEGRTTAVFSLEMSAEQLALRMLSSEAHVNLKDLRGGKPSMEDFRRVTEAMARLSEARLYLDDTPAIPIHELRARVRRLALQGELGLVVIDYLQLMQSRSSNTPREQQISEISRGLKALAKEFHVPVIALSQLNRSAETRPDKRPMLSDLRECVTGETHVLLADGRRRPIRDLVGSTPEVLAMDPDGRIVAARSDKVWCVGRRPVFAVTLASGRVIRATGLHRLYAAGGWTTVETLPKGARVAVARRTPPPRTTGAMSELKLALLGQLIGDGSYLSGQPMRYTTASPENSALVELAAHTEFGAEVKRYAGRGRWHQLLISGNGNRWRPEGVNRWLRELGVFGQRSHEKRVPECVFGLPDDGIATVLRHLWATDGSISVRRPGAKGASRVFFATCSRALAEDVAVLLLRLGIVARLRTAAQGKHRPVTTVDVSGSEDQLKFLDRVGAFGPRVAPAEALRRRLEATEANTNVDTLPREVFALVKGRMGELGVSQRKMAALRGTSYGGAAHFKFAPSRAVVAEYAELLDEPELRAMAHSDLFWDRVASIEPAGEEDVFDLTVPGPASWLADGIVSHNSGAIEQDADVIMFVYRDEYYNKETEDKGVAEIIVAKQRNGPTDTARLAFIGQFTKFGNLARNHEF